MTYIFMWSIPRTANAYPCDAFVSSGEGWLELCSDFTAS